MLERNVGGNDRLARIGFGSVFAFVGVVAAVALREPLVGALVALFGGGLLASGVACRCMVNELLDIDTAE
ncbi:DUF2892 domain-containing protein [Halostella sp. PRR32]|uniref:YgaP family membrane protein n=1 Tax=Halostella sp. PRR32 TaxID=3098147 RepID=UPI00110D790C|nr:DUF2892 domain-containing protein [Halostella sp. PRR32]